MTARLTDEELTAMTAMTARLTDEELTELERIAKSWMPDLDEPVINECKLAMLAYHALAELRELRAVLATPWPPLEDEPEAAPYSYNRANRGGARTLHLRTRRACRLR